MSQENFNRAVEESLEKIERAVDTRAQKVRDELAAKIEAGEQLTKSQIADLRDVTDKLIKAADEQRVAAESRGGASAAKTIVSDEFVKSLSTNPVQRTATGNMGLSEFKRAVFTEPAPTAPTGLTPQPYLGLQGRLARTPVADFFMQRAISVASASSVTFLKTSFTNNAAQVNQGVAKPESVVTFTPAVAHMETIAHTWTQSLQLLQDAPELGAFVSSQLANGLMRKLEGRLLDATASPSATQNKGLLAEAGAPLTNIAGLTNLYDVICYCLEEYDDRDDEAAPDSVVLHPRVFRGMRRILDANGGYIIPPNLPADATPFGVPVLTSQAMPQNRILLGSMETAAVLGVRANITVESTRYNGMDFVQNAVTMLAEMRGGLIAFRPTALLLGTIPTTYPTA